MGAETGRQAVADEDGGLKGMRDLVECRFGAPATNTGKTNSRAHPREILARQSGLCGRRLSGLHDGPPGLIEANSRRGGPRARCAEHPAVFVLDPGAAAGSAAINAEIHGTFCSHGKLTPRVRSGSSQKPRCVKSCTGLASRVRDCCSDQY
jgi:hypothetical protein